MIQQTIDIPRILVVPKGEVKIGVQAIHPRSLLDMQLCRRRMTNFGQAPAHRSGRCGSAWAKGAIDEQRLEDYVVSG